jgi:hypothetical protein
MSAAVADEKVPLLRDDNELVVPVRESRSRVLCCCTPSAESAHVSPYLEPGVRSPLA